MKKLLINATFSGMKNGVSLGSDNPISFALILEVPENFESDLKPLVHNKLVEMNQEICEPEWDNYSLNFTAQSF
jgi:hypothetical protein